MDIKIAWKKLLIAIAVLLIALLYFFADARTHPLPQCPFYSIVHLYCPGCGSQRAFSALLHGDILSALRDNILLVVFSPLLLYSALIDLRSNGKKKFLLWYHPLSVKIILIVVLSFWLLRNIPLKPFIYLAP